MEERKKDALTTYRAVQLDQSLISVYLIPYILPYLETTGT